MEFLRWVVHYIHMGYDRSIVYRMAALKVAMEEAVSVR